MTSYAPLLAKENHTQWRPDLIYFNNTGIKLTPDYYVQKMYGNNSGTKYIPTTRTLSNNNNDIALRLGESAVIDTESGDTIIRLVNMTPLIVKTDIGIKSHAIVTILTGNPEETDVCEKINEMEINDIYDQPAYSFSVLRFRNRK